MKEDMTQEEADEKVAGWFDLFEIQDFAEELMVKNKTVRPDLKWSENNYVLMYYQHCPCFRELMKRDDLEAVSYLWRIKKFEVKLNRKGMEAAPTLATCLSCKRTKDSLACTMRWNKNEI